MAELIVALDLDDPALAFDLLDRLPDAIAVKVGSILFTRAGPGLVRSLIESGYRVFLDLKWHDIPHTVASAVRGARELGVDMVTVHTSGGDAMLRAAADAAAGAVRVVGVTVLTSHDASSFAATVGRGSIDMTTEVPRLAQLAMSAGLDGVVASAEEIDGVKRVVGSGRIVVPGIRRSGDPAGDQQRTATPAEAVARGATHLVVGRPIVAAGDPAQAYAAFLQEL